ncbi:MAG: FecR domain-containing protein [Alphaproteobacteria bacterium]|nr:FecR domain-containing protein [Alphaproteobacteria bacterium]
MTATDSSYEQAAAWLDQMNRSVFDAADGERFDAWMNADPLNREAFAELAAIWDSEELETACAAEPAATAAPRRLFAAGWVSSARVALVAAATAAIVLFTATMIPRDYGSAPGEMRRVALADGTSVVLGGSSSISVRMLPWRRAIDLERGEASFDVAHDAARPMAVRIGETRVTVLGTAFHIDRLAADRVTVAVSRGSVRVNTGTEELDISRLEAVRAMSGRLQRVRFEPELQVASGWFVAKEAPLADLVEKLRRYSKTPIRITNGQARALRVTGRFKIADVAGTLNTLEGLYGIEIARRNSSIEISL